MSLRIVNLGLPRTGTTTLARALRRTGFKVADYRIGPRQTRDPALRGRFVADLLYDSYFACGDPGTGLGPFTALTEIGLLREGRSLWPQTDFALIRALRRHHPDLRFLASNRDGFALSQSMLGWSDLGTRRLPEAAVPGLPQGFGETTKQRQTWIAGHYANLRAFFAGDPAFLEYDIADPRAPELISAHVGCELAWWGRANASRVAG
ncbi:hypothetical protein R5H30_05935 [Sulfitobacter sp. D35]|uniref:hypothetical protein n=1 Tax=Sulfitobacter sp. D35 TaxID=3083252 RepID=UPI00296EBF21|nr:hypothetical protein [Sulfitobacter sp. D35]MDW4497514.1 hypothetical protein [Sulfitobacter sp. D35]